MGRICGGIEKLVVILRNFFAILEQEVGIHLVIARCFGLDQVE